MPVKSKKAALSSVKTRMHSVGGKEYRCFDVYLGTNEITGRQERLYANSMKEMERKIEDFYRQRSEAGDFATVLSAEQILDAKTALRELSEARLRISLAECAKREVARFRAVSVCDKRIGEAYDEFLALKEGKNRKKTVSTTGKWVLVHGADRFLGDVTPKEILEYLRTNYGGMKPKTYNAHLSYLGTFFNWCTEKTQRYLAESPVADLKPKDEAWEEPEFMSTEDCRKLILGVWEVRERYPDCMALTVNGLMMGIRREESLRMAVDDDAVSVNLEDETVRIKKPKGYTKGITPRSFHMPEMAVAWAKAFPYHDAVRLFSEQTTKRIRRIAEEVGANLPKNGYRHTFVTKHVAAYEDPAKTQAIVGTSDKMRANNYCGLDSKKEGEAFFAITPPTSQPRAT